MRGETAHYEAIYNEVARGIGQSQQETGIPHSFGVLTCETLELSLIHISVDYDPAKKYPLIVEVHGGPASAALSHWDSGYGLSAAAFSAQGYFVLLPNPRGSYGQGEAFTQANRKDFGYGDLRDILAGVDTVLALSLIHI